MCPILDQEENHALLLPADAAAEMEAELEK